MSRNYQRVPAIPVRYLRSVVTVAGGVRHRDGRPSGLESAAREDGFIASSCATARRDLAVGTPGDDDDGTAILGSTPEIDLADTNSAIASRVVYVTPPTRAISRRTPPQPREAHRQRVEIAILEPPRRAGNNFAASRSVSRSWANGSIIAGLRVG